MTAKEKEAWEEASHSISAPKRQLIEICNLLEETCPKKASRLGNIIAALEAFQNTKQ